MTPRTRVIVCAAALLAPIVAVGAWDILFSKTPLRSYDYLSEIVRTAGYDEPTLPTRLYGPGTINTWEIQSNGKIVLHPTCNVDEAVVEPLLLKERTLMIRRTIGDENVLDASSKVLTSLGSTTAAKQITRITVSLGDVYEVTMSQENLMKVLKRYLKDTCEEVVLNNLRVGSIVCQTVRTLEADVVYHLSYSKSLSSAQKADLRGEVAGSLDLTFDSSLEDELYGKGLYLGVTAYNNCFQLHGGDVDVAAGTPGQSS